jgi:predicted TIM-barrel fold metal-dependent hydrolase
MSGMLPQGACAPVPDAARLRDVFLDWTRDAATQQAILTDNPARLYGFAKV